MMQDAVPAFAGMTNWMLDAGCWKIEDGGWRMEDGGWKPDLA